MKAMLLMVCFTSCMLTLAQDPAHLPQEEENILEGSANPDEEDERVQQWHAFRKNPLDLNRASAAELQLLGLNAFQISALIEHRKKFGDLIAVQELQAIKGWDLNTIRELLPYITSGQTGLTRDRIKHGWKKGEHVLLWRVTRILEKSKGFLNPAGASFYEGGPQKTLLRYRYQSVAGIQGGFTMEKDAGEKLFGKGKQLGPDFTSAHIQIRNAGVLQSLVAGDFKIQMGQGLILWQGNGFRKGAGSMLVKRQGPLMLPYSGAGEFLFLRGIGAEWGKGRWKVLTFFSVRKISASLDINSQGEKKITTILQAGLHRSVAELEKRNNVQYATYGFSTRYHFKSGHLSLNAVQHLFSIPFSTGSHPYEFFEFNGDKMINASLDYNFTRNNFHASGEWAINQSGNFAIANNVMIALDNKADLVLLHRHFQQSYSSFQSGAFSDQPVPKNESGFYTGISLRPHIAWKVDAYADLAKFPWLKFRADAPSSAYGYALLLRYTPSRKAEWYARYRKELTGTNVVMTEADHFNTLKNISLSSLRMHFSLQLTRQWSIRQRVELTSISDVENRVGRNGNMYYAEAFYKTPSGRSGYNFRIVLFNTDGYDTRIYQYEQDVLFNASVPAVEGRGLRYYLNAHRKLYFHKLLSSWKADVYLRFSQTLYADRQIIGSGMDEINGNKKSELKVQLIISSG